MATRNGPYLARAVESVLNQSWRDFEFIIVDDASALDTNFPTKYGDDRIQLLRNVSQCGLSVSLNHGIRSAHGELIARIDDDDVWIDPNKLVAQVSFMKKHPRAGLCGTQCVVIDERGREQYRSTFKNSDKEIRRCILAENQFIHSSVVIRMSALRTVGMYDTNIRYAQDFELWLRIGTRFHFANLPQHAILLRVSNTSVSSVHSRAQFLSFVKSAYRYRRSYAGFLSNLPRYALEGFLNILGLVRNKI